MRAASIERLTIVFPGAMGDLLLALPSLRAMVANHRARRVTLVVPGHLVAMARLTGVASIVASLDAADAAALFRDGPPPSWLTSRPTVYSWLGAQDDEVRARIAAAARSARFFRIERGSGAEHAAVAYARALGVGLPAATLVDLAKVPVRESPAAEGLLAALRPALVLAVHPGAGARAKRWDAAGFVQTAEWWCQRGGQVLEIAGPAEAGEPLLLGSPAARELPLPDLATVLARATLYLGNDSGVSHLAGAVGAAGVVLFGPTDARRWRPIGGRLGVLQARAPGPDGITLAALPAARVIAALERRLTLTTRNPNTSVRARRSLACQTPPQHR